jgi:transmembrane sensor
VSEPDDQTLEAAAHWVAVLKRGAPSGSDQRALKAWLRQDIAHAGALDLMMQVWAETGALADRPITRAPAAPRSIRRSPAWTWAPLGGAVLAGLAAVAVIAPVYSRTYETAVGQMTAINLPDHSTVWLNTDSRLTVSYSLTRRSLSLERGEAEFKVAHEATRPFLVDTPNAQVRATGTEFSVRYDDGLSHIDLVEGTVRVKSLPAATEETRLTAGYALDVAGAGPFRLTKADPQTDLAWRNGQLVFFERPLDQVVREFARYSGIKVRFADVRAERLKITGAFRAADFSSFLRDVSAVDGVRAVEDHGEVVIASGR